MIFALVRSYVCLFLLVLFSVFALAPVQVFAATACPQTEVQNGGTYCVINENQTDHVNVWRPAGYNPATAAIVVYQHGNIERESLFTDGTWNVHQLGAAFASSGVNALFIVPRGSNCSSGCENQVNPWGSLDQLLSTVATQTGIPLPNGPVIIASHSGGYRASSKWMSDPRVKGFIGLETFYGNAPVFENWLQAATDHRMILVSSNGSEPGNRQNYAIREIHRRLAASVDPGVAKDTNTSPGSLSAEERQARVIYLKVGLAHGDLPTQLLGPLLSIIVGPSAAPSSPPPPEGVPSNFELIKPILNVVPLGFAFSNGVFGDTTISVPFLAEYIETLYVTLLGAAIAIAIVMLMIGGFQYTLGAASAAQVQKGKERIRNALIGLVLLFGAVAIVVMVNPNLGNLNAITLGYINERKVKQPDTTQSFVQSGAVPVGGPTVRVCKTVAECGALCQMPKSEWPKTSAGIMDPSLAKAIPDAPGLVGNGKTTSQETLSLLLRAGEIAFARNPDYVITVHSGYRPLEGQIQLACDKIAVGDPSGIGSDVAWPGTSLHGVGYAVDVSLKQRGRIVSPCCLTAKQADPGWKEGAAILSEIMTEAGFQRYNKEVWHFEPKRASASCRCEYPNCPFPPTSC